MIDDGSRELFKEINRFGPAVHEFQHLLRPSPNLSKPNVEQSHGPRVDLKDWRTTKQAVRNFVSQNFNPGLLRNDNSLRIDIFERISSTAGLFLALEPQVFVEKIRARIFRTWRAGRLLSQFTTRS